MSNLTCKYYQFNKMKTLIISFTLLFAALYSHAANVAFSTNEFLVLLNHKFSVPVFIKADEEIYSVSADIIYDSSYISVPDIDDNITNGVQPDFIFSDAFPNEKKFCAALEDDVQGRLVWGVSHNLPTSSGTIFSTNSLLVNAFFNAEKIGTNNLMFGFKKITDSAGNTVTANWNSANVYVITDKLPAPDPKDFPQYSPGRSKTIHWQPVDDAEFYQTFCAFDSLFSNIHQQSTLISDTNFTFTSLIETTQYFYLVLATNSIGQRGYSVTNSSIQDFNPPTNISFTVNYGNYYINQNIIPVIYYGEDITPMRVKTDINDGSVGSWKPYYINYTYYYTSTWVNGEKTLTGFFKDSAGQTSAVSATICLDSIAPSNVSLVINNGVGTTTVTSVALELNATDVNPIEMIIANKSDFSDGSWENFASSKSWNIQPNGAGTYSVYARFRDLAGNLSSIAFDDIYYDTAPGSDTNILLTSPANGASFMPGNITFAWNAGADINNPQYLKITPGNTYPAIGQTTVSLANGSYTWFVYATNSWNTVSKSETRSLTVSSSLIEPIPAQSVREHQVLFVNLVVNSAAELSYQPDEINGAHYLDTNRCVFSLIPDFDTAGQNWNVPFIAQLNGNVDTQNMAVSVNTPAKKITKKKALRFEDTDSDIIDIKYNGIKKNNSIVAFDGQRLIISNAYNKGKLVFKVKRNKKGGGDGAFYLHEILIDDSGKGVSIAASVGKLLAENFSIGSIKIGGESISNIFIESAKVISVKKGSVIGTIVVSNGFKKLLASDIIGAKIIVHNGDNISIKTKNNINNSTIIVNGTANALAVKSIGTGGKGAVTDSKIIVGLGENDNYTNSPAQAGFKLIKSKTMTNVEIAGSDYAKGKKGKTKEPKIKVKTPNNSTFYHTKSGVVTPEPIQ